jgi:hypothetical protein
MDYTDEELEFLGDVLAHVIIEMAYKRTNEENIGKGVCKNEENIRKGVCKNCPHKRVCDTVIEIFDKG